MRRIGKRGRLRAGFIEPAGLRDQDSTREVPTGDLWVWRDHDDRSERIDDVVVGRLAGRWRVVLHNGDLATDRHWPDRLDAKDWAEAHVPLGSRIRCLEGPTAASRWPEVSELLERLLVDAGGGTEPVRDPEALLSLLRSIEWGYSGSARRSRSTRPGDFVCPSCGRQRYPRIGPWGVHDPACPLAKAIGARSGERERPKATAKDPGGVAQLGLFGEP